MVWHFLLAFHKSMSWNNRKCSASVTFVSLVILYHIPAFHTVEVIFYIYIDFFLQYTYSLRKKLAKTFPLPIWIKVSHACFPVSRRNVYYQKQIRRVIDARTNKQTNKESCGQSWCTKHILNNNKKGAMRTDINSMALTHFWIKSARTRTS